MQRTNDQGCPAPVDTATTQFLHPRLREPSWKSGHNDCQSQSIRKSVAEVCLLEMAGKFLPWHPNNIAAQTRPEQGFQPYNSGGTTFSTITCVMLVIFHLLWLGLSAVPDNVDYSYGSSDTSHLVPFCFLHSCFLGLYLYTCSFHFHLIYNDSPPSFAGNSHKPPCIK